MALEMRRLVAGDGRVELADFIEIRRDGLEDFIGLGQLQRKTDLLRGDAKLLVGDVLVERGLNRAVRFEGQCQRTCNTGSSQIIERGGETRAPAVAVLKEAHHARIVTVQLAGERTRIQSQGAIVVDANAELAKAVDVALSVIG